MNKNISLKKVLKNGGLFVALILITFFVIFHNNNVEDMLKAISCLNIKYIIIGIICSSMFVICEGINISRSLKLMEYNISIFTCIKYAIVGLFFSSVTPSASGGQPMQLYFMHKDNIQISHSSLVLLMDLASFQFVTAVLAIVGYISQHELLVNTLGNIKYFVAVGIILNTLVLIFILTAIFSEGFITKIINFVCFILEKLKYKKIEKFREISTVQLNEYKEGAVYFKENKFTVLKVVLTSTVQIIALHSVTFWIYKAFNLSGYSFITVVMLQSVLYISVSALPLPGAVGVSESGFMIIYKTLFSAKILSSAMLVSRGISFYLLVFFSGIIIATNYILNIIRGKNYLKVTEKEEVKTLKYNILVVEDDIDIIKLLKIYLENDGHQVISAENGLMALNIIENVKVDLVVMDIMMPKMDGYELTKKIREKYTVPIIILSAKNEDNDKILGLNLGADDYITKPFNPLEIVARVNSNLRRFYNFNNSSVLQKEDTKLVVGDLVLDKQKLALYKKGEEVFLTPTEYKILLLLMKIPGKVYTKLQICEAINGDYIESDNNTMMVHVSRLRDKVEDDSKNPKYIKTVRGIGYKIEKQ